MATLVDVTAVESVPIRRSNFSAIRWGAVFAGLFSGSASYLLLALLGLAVGLTAIDPNAPQPVGNVPLGTGIWTGISMLVAAFIGGYVTGHMSGLARSSDGMLHGFVVWGVTTLLYVFLATSAVGAVLGGTFRLIGQGLQAAAPMVESPGGEQSALDRVSNMITGAGGRQVNTESLNALQQAISAGDRDAAVNIMVNDMGVAPDTAAQLYDRVGPLLSAQNARGTVTQATEVLTAASWWLFIGLLLSLALSIIGGAAGVRANANRTMGEHIDERQPVG